MHLIPPHDRNSNWTVRLRNHDGRYVKISGYPDEGATRRMADRIVMLVSAKQHGEPSPGHLAEWLNNMEESVAQRLVKLGLVPPRHLYRHRAIADWIDPWVAVVQGRKPEARRHAPQQGQKVRRIIKEMDASLLADLEEDAVVEAINGLKTLGTKNPKVLATSSRRGHGIAIKDFAGWVARKLKAENPLIYMELPGQYENPEYERQPLTVKQFQRLMDYLDGFDRYKGQKATWSAYDRKMIYWTAVKTGYREGEMIKLRRWNLFLDEKPAVISLKARDTKGKVKGEVPIPRDLAIALKKYVVNLGPNDKAFPFPETSGSIVDMLRRDLKGAGIPWKLPGGEVIDFHTFRSTFITWALDVDGLSPKRVQILARLKTLALVGNYSRNLRIEDFGWLDKGPKLVSPKRKKAG